MRSYVKRISKKVSKLSRDQLEQLLDEMVDESENFYSIMESLSTGLIILDNSFCILQFNTIAESLLAFSTHLDNLKESHLPIWDFLDDEDVSEFLMKCFSKEMTNASEDFSTVTSGGTIRFISITMTPLIHNGELSGRILHIRDITEKKNQDVLLHRMENMANLTNLAAGMAHDIKNPLGAISIHIQLVQKALEKARENENILPPKKFVEDHIDIVNEEIQHLNDLVMDFLFAVRPVNAKLELKDPVKTVTNLIQFLELEFHKHNIDIKFNAPSEPTRIMIDEKLFRDVLMNLSQNSLAAIKSKFPECNTEVKEINSENFSGQFYIDCEVRNNKYFIRVGDNGCGMSSETAAKVFEPYFTTKSNGTGLGMTTVYKIVKEFSGEIQVHSEEGKGTCFVMVFPVPQNNTKLLNSN